MPTYKRKYVYYVCQLKLDGRYSSAESICNNVGKCQDCEIYKTVKVNN